MANKHLLSCLGQKQKKTYSVQQNSQKVQGASNITTGSCPPMAGRYKTSSSSSSASNTVDAPPLKKRKTEESRDEEGDGLWDESLEFTQADLDDLEIQASQAYTSARQTEQPTVPPQQPSTSSMVTGNRGRQTDRTGQFVKPQLSKSSSSNTSSSSFNDHSSDTSHTYPSSLSGYGSRSSSSLKSGSSSEMQYSGPRQHGRLSRGSSNESLDITAPSYLRNTGATGSRDGEAGIHTTDSTAIDSVKHELTKTLEELCVKEGENKVLRDNLRKQKEELEHMKSEKVKQIAQQNREQSEKEKALTSMNARLQTQLQFKEQECRELESQYRSVQASSAASQVSVSPKPRRVLVEERSPKNGASFPSTKTFRASEGSPVKQAVVVGEPSKSQSVSTDVKDKATMTAGSRRRNVRFSITERRTTGPDLVATLLEVGPDITGGLSERGLAAVLQARVTSLRAGAIHLDRDQTSSLLSPVRNRRLSELRVQQQRTDLTEIVSVEHFTMAIQAVTSLLRCDPVQVPPGVPVMGPGGDNSASTDVTCSDLPVKLLPLLNSYLTHYVDMLSSSAEKLNVTSPSNTSSSNSYDSSLESLTGSLSLLLRDTAMYANNLEQLALVALKSLLKLVQLCNPVRMVLLRGHDTEKDLTEGPSMSSYRTTEPEASRDSLNSICRLQVLRKVYKLANPDNNCRLYNVEVVKVALSILTQLAVEMTEDQFNSLIPVLHDEVIQSCLDTDGEPVIQLHALQLLRVLATSNVCVTSFCSIAGCVLQSMYNLCGEAKLSTASREQRLQIYQSIVECLSIVAGSHKGGVTILLESDCACSVQIIQSVVTMLHTVLQLHQAQGDSTSLRLLQGGLNLLHILSQQDTNFTEHHIDVQQQFVSLCCGLVHVFKTELPDNDNELSALQDLMDFNRDDSVFSQYFNMDDSELSQGSDEEEDTSMDYS